MHGMVARANGEEWSRPTEGKAQLSDLQTIKLRDRFTVDMCCMWAELYSSQQAASPIANRLMTDVLEVAAELTTRQTSASVCA